MRFVTLFEHGPTWRPGRTVFEQGPAIEAHLDAMRRRYDEGALLLGGPFDDDHGGIAVLDAPTGAAAAAMMDSDPAVHAGVLHYRLHRLHAYFDAFASVRASEDVAALARRRLAGSRR